MKIFKLWVFLGLLLFPIGIFSNTSQEIIIVDSMNRKVVFEKSPQRIISVAPSITEIIFALGKKDLLIARTDYCNYPEEVLNIESIGSLKDPNLEKIIELNPNAVLVSTHFKPENIRRLESLGIKVLAFYSDDTIKGVYNIIEKAGRLLKVTSKAKKIILNIKDDIRYVKELVSKAKKRPRVYYVIGFGQWGDFTAGGNTFIHELLEMAGGHNIARNLKGWAYSFEKILEADPEIIICSKYYKMKEGLELSDNYKELNAVKNGKLYAFDNNTIDRQGPRLGEGLKALAKIIHGDLF